jgi:hypothetical protein
METKIVISDENIRAKFLAAGGRAEVCDPSGQTVGVLISRSEYQDLKRAAGEVEFTPEYLAEISRCAAEGRYKTTAEVLAMLKRLDQALDGTA